eukprot:m.33620 g.33620  ORF g.33620 m.33620 type:complete len:466 (+) comp14246_c0_seq1:738-2135(+)
MRRVGPPNYFRPPRLRPFFPRPCWDGCNPCDALDEGDAVAGAVVVDGRWPCLVGTIATVCACAVCSSRHMSANSSRLTCSSSAEALPAPCLDGRRGGKALAEGREGCRATSMTTFPPSSMGTRDARATPSIPTGAPGATSCAARRGGGMGCGMWAVPGASMSAADALDARGAMPVGRGSCGGVSVGVPIPISMPSSRLPAAWSAGAASGGVPVHAVALPGTVPLCCATCAEALFTVMSDVSRTCEPRPAEQRWPSVPPPRKGSSNTTWALLWSAPNRLTMLPWAPIGMPDVMSTLTTRSPSASAVRAGGGGDPSMTYTRCGATRGSTTVLHGDSACCCTRSTAWMHTADSECDPPGTVDSSLVGSDRSHSLTGASCSAPSPEGNISLRRMSPRWFDSAVKILNTCGNRRLYSVRMAIVACVTCHCPSGSSRVYPSISSCRRLNLSLSPRSVFPPEFGLLADPWNT